MKIIKYFSGFISSLSFPVAAAMDCCIEIVILIRGCWVQKWAALLLSSESRDGKSGCSRNSFAVTAAWGFSCPSCDLRHLPCCIFRAVVQRRLAKDLISMWIWILSQIWQCSPYLGDVFGLVSQLYHQAVHCHVPLPWPLFLLQMLFS